MIVSTLGYIFTDHKALTFRIEDKIEMEDGTCMFISDFNSYIVSKDIYDYYDKDDTFNITNNNVAHDIWSTFLFLSFYQILFMLLDKIYNNCRYNNI